MSLIFLFVIFFFSSRRRHTRFPRDWSSDVCSSDLTAAPAVDTPGWDPLRILCAVQAAVDGVFARHREGGACPSGDPGGSCSGGWPREHPDPEQLGGPHGGPDRRGGRAGPGRGGVRLARLGREGLKGIRMDWENLLALLVAVAVTGYFVYTLIRPERF